jgi:hypothetical protein
MLTSTANDQLAEFDIDFTGITLTSQSGKTVSLLASAPVSSRAAEFIHINGTAEPLATATIPQDVYTSASVTFDDRVQAAAPCIRALAAFRP